MPKPLQYRSGSVIYFQSDAPELIYIVKTGSVSLAYQDVETGEDLRDVVQPGEFFGVKSALGRYPREENAMAMQDSNLVGFSVTEFEQLAMANIRIIMKMLKVFSNQMRRIHKQLSSLLDKEEAANTETGLFNVGEYYLKNKRFSQAKYVFGRYLTYYPSGRNAAQAAKYLETAETSLARYGNEKGPSVTGDAGAGLGELAAPKAEVSTESSKAYYDALSLISQEKYQQA